MNDELRYIEQEAREQGEADCCKQLIEEAFALYSRLCGDYWRAGRIGRVRIGPTKYRAWKRWMRRKEQSNAF